MLNFNTDISGLTPPVLLSLADHVREFAQQLEALANDNERKLMERRRNSNYKRSVVAASRYFSSLIEAEKPTDKALDIAATKHCVEPDAIKMHVTMYAAKQKRLEKMLRDRKIMQSWRAGHDVRSIAKSANVTPRTVQRVINEFRTI